MKLKTPLFTLITLFLIGCSGSSESDNQENQEVVAFITSFDYQPEKPVDGKMLGIIELGYSGFNSFVVTMDKEDRWKLESENYGESFVGENSVTIEYVLTQIQKYRDDMIKSGVDKNNINFVASSSAIKNEKVNKITAELRALNMGVINVEPDLEGNYAHIATVPKGFARNAYMVDIGSGNTKITWLENGEMKTVETYGSKYYQEEIADSLVSASIKNIIKEIPAINRNLCFLIGGFPYQIAEKTNQREGRYTRFNTPSSYIADGYQQKSGLVIYDAIWEEETIDYVFDWESNFSIGVLMEVN